MELSTVAQVLTAFYRLVGTESDDPELEARGETDDEVAYTFLTRGCRNAQRWMLKTGYGGWRARSSAITWSGTEAANGGRYTALPSDFLRAFGNKHISALREADGTPWGREVEAEDDRLYGDYYYLRGQEELWIVRGAGPPSTLYLEYHYTHPLWDSSLDDADIDFPMDARYLIVAEAANAAKEENWLVGGAEMEQKIERALVRARLEAGDVARPTKSPRQMRKPYRIGNHY